MENITQRQKRFLENFLLHSTRVIQNGFAYLFNHPSLIPMMDCEMKRIRAMEKEQQRFPKAKARYQQMLRHAYIEYIVKLTKFGFKYVKCNPKAYNEIKALQSIFDEYEKLREECQKNTAQRTDRRSFEDPLNDDGKNFKKNQQKVSETEDAIWKETFKQIKDLNTKIDALQAEMKSQTYKSPCMLKETQETLKKFNEYLEEKLDDINAKKQQRKQKREKLKLQAQHEIPSAVPVADSDNDSSEILLNFEQFEKPLLKSARAGTIERHLVIPIHGNKAPKIIPRIEFNKSPNDGNMQLDLKLNFDGGVLYQNKLVDGILIENALPERKYRDGK